MLLYILILSMLFWGLLGALAGRELKGRTAAGFFWGAFLGPFGLLVILIGPNYKESQ